MEVVAYLERQIKIDYNHMMENHISTKELTTDELKSFNNSLKLLHKALMSNFSTREEAMIEYLKVGCDIFNLPVGIVSFIKDDEYTVMATISQDGSVKKGQVFPLEGTYCREVFDKKATVALGNIGAHTKMCKHPVYEAMKLESYLSAPIWVFDRIYGTINFTSTVVRPDGFFTSEIEMIELMAQNIGKMLELIQVDDELKRARKDQEDERVEAINQRQFYEDILNNMIDGYVIHDRSGAIKNFNPRAYEILGVSESQLLGKTSMDPLWRCIKENGENFPGEEHPAMVSLKTGQSCHRVIMGVYTPDDKLNWIAINSVPLYQDEKKTPSHVIVTLSDITKTIQYQELLKDAKQVAEKSSKAKTEFLANMSHEIRTPLNGIVGMLSLLEDSKLDHDQQENLKMIQQSSDILLAIINDILDISKIESGKMDLNEVSVDLNETINKCFDLFKDKAKQKNINYQIVIDESLPSYVITDDVKLMQVVNNLIGNAIKFTNKGEVTLTVKVIEFRISSVTVEISVLDSGVGISRENEEKLFKAFSQADSSVTREFGGTGLGLIISKKLARMMGGDINVISKKDKGSTFTFFATFPIATSKLSEGNITNGELRADLKILLVEDNLVNQKIVEKMLAKIKIEVDIVENGQIAIEAITAKKYDIVLMDIQMPVMDGITATHKLMELKLDHTPVVIAMTANAFSEDRKACIDVGMRDFIAKPVKKEKLYNILRKYQD